MSRHGHTGVTPDGRVWRSPTYQSWRSMKGRCNDPDRYGGNGIGYDPAWERFDNFLADVGERPDGCTLHRLDHSADYTKENCEWRKPPH